MSKESTKAALMRYYERQLPKEKRKNEKPEKIVEAEVLAWCRSKEWFIQCFEAKSVFSEKQSRYISSTMKTGTPDLIGITNNGLFAAIELKAPGRRSTLRPKQRKFLIEIISRGGFAVCTDSVFLLSSFWEKFNHSENKKTYLLSILPKEKIEPNFDLFDE